MSVDLSMPVLVVSGIGHDAVVGAAGPGAAGAGAVPAEHLRGGPAVEFYEVAFRSAAVQPGVTEVVRNRWGARPCRTGGRGG